MLRQAFPLFCKSTVFKLPDQMQLLAHLAICFSFHFSQGGIYVLNLFDSHSGGLSLVLVVIFEAVAVSWGYG